MIGVIIVLILGYLTGLLLETIGKGKETSWMWKCLIGFFFLLLCQGPIFMAAQMLQWNFRKAAFLAAVVLALPAVLSLIFCGKKLLGNLRAIRGAKRMEKIQLVPYVLLSVLFLGMVFLLFHYSGTLRQDAYAETVQRTLYTDTMNQYHPLTGQQMEMIFSKKMITLPFFYSMLSLFTGAEGTTMVWVWGSLLTFFLALAAQSELAGLLFHRDPKKTWLFVLFLELLYLAGDYAAGAFGYRQLLYGYQGETIVAGVLLPLVVATLYRCFGQVLDTTFDKEREGLSLWKGVLVLGICVGSSLFLTSLATGALLILITVAIFFLCMGLWLAGCKICKSRK